MAVLKTGAKIAVSAGDPNAFPESVWPGAGRRHDPQRPQRSHRPVANALQGNLLDKPVVNQTGLTGKYDFALKFTPDASQLANFGPLPPGAPLPTPMRPPISSPHSSNSSD